MTNERMPVTWARAWLTEVEEARKALDRAEGAMTGDTPPSGPHGDAYGDIGAMVAGCGS